VTLCLVTDRRRLAGAGATPDGARRCLIAQAQHAVEAAIDLIQVRERDLPASELSAIVRELLVVARGTRTRVIVNDRLDVALACGADGVHLRGDSVAPCAARRLAPKNFLIGRSVHSVEEAGSANEADFLIAGTVFPTVSKDESAPLLGVAGLQAIVRRARVPVLAIGGVTEATAGRIASAGAAGCAGIGLFMDVDGVHESGACRAIPLAATADRMRRLFDNSENRSLT
jgi:thiamine-phosphate pyrophosphorylase